MLEEVVTRFGKDWDGRGAQKWLGKRPVEAAASVVEEYDLPCTPVAFNDEVIALLQDRFDVFLFPVDVNLWDHLQASILR